MLLLKAIYKALQDMMAIPNFFFELVTFIIALYIIYTVNTSLVAAMILLFSTYVRVSIRYFVAFFLLHYTALKNGTVCVISIKDKDEE